MNFECVKGNTWHIDIGSCTLGFYRTGAHTGILIDTGFSSTCRKPLEELFAREQLHPEGIIVSHTHYDHAGNADYLKRRWGCPILASLTEAGLASCSLAYRYAYPAMTPREVEDLLGREGYIADEVVRPGELRKEFCGVSFGILPLGGHTPGQIGIVTPDNVAYLADVIVSDRTLRAAKMSSCVSREEDLRSKMSLFQLRCDAYILAHTGIYRDIRPLTGRNIAYVYNRAALVLSCLEDGMFKEEWVRAVFRRLEIQGGQPFKCAVAERNIRSFIDYLSDTGRVKMERREGVGCYWHCAG